MVQTARGELVRINPTTPAEEELAPRCVKQGITHERQSTLGKGKG